MRNRHHYRRRKKTKRLVVLLATVAVFILVALTAVLLSQRSLPQTPQAFSQPSSAPVATLADPKPPDWVDIQLIDVDGFSRRGELLDGVRDIVIHYIGNPGTTAQQNRDYFNNSDSSVSSHFVIGLEGEVIQCVPLNEKSSASNERNKDTISIEVCHPDASGTFTEASYSSLIRLVAWLCDTLALDSGRIIRHYDVTGKLCPLYYVENEDAWLRLKEDVAQALHT